MSGIGFKNFRRFQEFPPLFLNNINFLVGGNNAGKSTFNKAYILILEYLQSDQVENFSFSSLSLEYGSKMNYNRALNNASGDNFIEFSFERLYYRVKLRITGDELFGDGEVIRNGIMGFTNKVSSEDSKIIIGRVGAHCGNVHLAHGKKWVSDNALIVETGQNLDYMSILLKSLDLNKLANKNAQPLITGSIIKDQIVPYPTSQVEQQEIVSFIKKHKLTSTLLLEKLLYQIEKLKEYRQSVISEAVTGKVDVRNWLPDKH